MNLSEVGEIAIYQEENKLYLFIWVYSTGRGVFAQFEVFLRERELLTWSTILSREETLQTGRKRLVL